jgi:hypothetical protein
MKILRHRATLSLAAIGLICLVGGGGYVVGAKSAAAQPHANAPAPLPAHVTLTRTDFFLLDNTHDWFYTVPQLSEEAITAFYRARLPHDDWQCVAAATSINMTYYGQQLTGTSVFITAIRGGTILKIYLGDQDYGAFLLGDDLPDGAIALKLTTEPATKTNFTCASA